MNYVGRHDYIWKSRVTRNCQHNALVSINDKCSLLRKRTASHGNNILLLTFFLVYTLGTKISNMYKSKIYRIKNKFHNLTFFIFLIFDHYKFCIRPVSFLYWRINLFSVLDMSWKSQFSDICNSITWTIRMYLKSLVINLSYLHMW